MLSSKVLLRNNGVDIGDVSVLQSVTDVTGASDSRTVGGGRIEVYGFRGVLSIRVGYGEQGGHNDI